MQKKVMKKLNHLLLAVSLPLLAGCQGAALGALGIGSLFAGGGGPGGGGILPPGPGGDIAVLSNPEPTSMLLVGGGMAAMAYFKSRKK